MMTLVLALRGIAAIGVLTTLAGGIPRIVQAGLAITIGLWSALIVEAPPLPDDAAGLLLVAVRELVIGASLGLVAVLPLLIASTAGRLVDAAGTGRGVYRGLFGVLAAAVFVGIDGHVATITAIAESFRDVPAIAQPGVLAAIAALIGSAVRLAVPWLVTAAVVEIALGVSLRLAGRAGVHAPGAAAVPAALVVMTAALVGTLAIAIAAIVRGTL